MSDLPRNLKATTHFRTEDRIIRFESFPQALHRYWQICPRCWYKIFDTKECCYYGVPHKPLQQHSSTVTERWMLNVCAQLLGYERVHPKPWIGYLIKSTDSTASKFLLRLNACFCMLLPLTLTNFYWSTSERRHAKVKESASSLLSIFGKHHSWPKNCVQNYFSWLKFSYLNYH